MTFLWFPVEMSRALAAFDFRAFRLTFSVRFNYTLPTAVRRALWSGSGFNCALAASMLYSGLKVKQGKAALNNFGVDSVLQPDLCRLNLQHTAIWRGGKFPRV